MSIGTVFKKNDYTDHHFECEYLVIGSGAGGSVTANILSEKGKDVIVLEEGPYFTRKDFKPNVSEMTAKLYRNQGVFPFLGSPTIAFAEGSCVGGGTVINGGLIWRTPEWILDEWVSKHGLTEYSNNKLLPYFEKVEKNLHVQRHELEPKTNLDSTVLKEGAENLNWKYVMVPRAIKNCINENWCPTGCISGGKQSMIETYIPKALTNGIRLLAECKAEKILKKGSKAHQVIARTANGKKITISFTKLILACGTIQTAHLLKRSKLSKLAGKNFEFHINLKVVALHKNNLNAEKGSIFTVQVQEFEKEGTLIMPSNLKPNYVAMTLSHFKNDTINYVLENYEKSGIYVGMIKPESKGHIYSGLGKQPFVWQSFNKRDVDKIKSALLKTCQVLFESGCTELFLPILNSTAVKSLQEADIYISNLSPKQVEMISVHSMSSCPMGTDPKKSVVNPEGKLWDYDNVFITDASILPTNIGESPQGTIMAFAHKITEEYIL